MAGWSLIAGWGATMTETQIKGMTGTNPSEVVCHNAFSVLERSNGR